MKVAIVRQQYNPFGGAEKFVNTAIQALRHAGAEPTVICNAWSDLHPSNAADVVQLPITSHWTRQGKSAAFAEQVRDYLAAHAVDLVQTHERIPGFDIFRAGDGLHKTWLNRRSVQASWLRRKLTQWDPYHSYLLDQEKKLLEHPGLKGIICNSEMIRSEILEHYVVDKQKIAIIRNGVDTDYYRPPTDIERARSRGELGVNRNRTVFTYVGSGFERKGVKQLLHAMTHLSDAHLFIVGSDKHLRRYQELTRSLRIDEKVTFKGPQKNVRDFYWAADAMVFPTLYDPCPNAVLEAMACGLGVITTPYCGALELLTPGQSATICSPWNHREIADAMTFFQDAQRAEFAGKLARQAIAPYTIDRMGQELMTFYKQLIQTS